ncbi:MAG: serine hydrolase [Opitutales bacterium]|jgi:CubicO group peptidase (beta-lactamase class C family)|nr:serine hydrolase [Opitutales bacterium]
MKRIALIFLFVLWAPLCAVSAPTASQLKKAAAGIQSLIDSGMLVGAQLAIGHEEQILLNKNFGVRSIEDDTAVDSETMFCIGSCSKPIASAVVMTLVDDKSLVLDKPIDAWLPEFGSLKTDSGESSRAPTLAELLSHHGGVYSQKKKMTRRQSRWIRDFTLSLEESVTAIAKEPLYSKPGDEYAYSGAGYCVLGRVAEVAGDHSFEEVLQARLCNSLELMNTSYFPSQDNANIASGSAQGKINKTTPHLYQPFRLPLIGGSLYSTAGDSALFLQSVWRQASSKEEILMSAEQFEAYTTPYSDKQRYAFGWSQMMANGKPFGISHSGSLASSRALFQINLEKDVYLSLLYTISDFSEFNEIRQRMSNAIRPVTGKR